MGRTRAGETRERVLRFVSERLIAGRPPTVREVQQAFGFRSVQTAREHLEALIAERRLTKERGQSRGLRLPAGGTAVPVLVPLLGRVPAGPLAAAIEAPEGYVATHSRTSGELFALRVHGASMSGAGILDRDLVIVRRQPTAHSGDIVVALVKDEATVKRLRLRGTRVELHPENPDFEVIVPAAGELTLLGKVIEVRRILEPA
jgi:repressor LexA